MNRILSLALAALGNVTVASLPAPGQSPHKYTDAEVGKIHDSLMIVDTHNDVTSATVQGLDIGKARTEGHTDLPRMRAGNLNVQFFAVFVAANYTNGNHSANRALQMIDTVRHDIVERYPKDFELALTSSDIVRIHKTGRIAALMGIEGGHAIEDSPRLLRQFFNLGIRYMTLTHSNNNNWASSSGVSGKPDKGLDPKLGREIVDEMNRLGMMVDISHVSDKTFWDVLALSKAPPLASHSSCRAISNIPRNMTDEMIQALAKKGGVVQVNFGCEFLSQASADSSPMKDPAVLARAEALALIGDPAERAAARRKLFAEFRGRTKRATLADAVAHIDHIVKIAGIDYAGIGGDYDGVGCVPEGLDDVSKFPNLTRALLEKGYTPAGLKKIYGGNLLRVMAAAEKTAASARAN